MSENGRYLCKAKRVDNKKWIQGYLFEFWGKSHILWGMVNDCPDMVEVDPSTICQCTGLRDKADKLIWENDVVTYTDELVNKVKIDKIGWNETHAAFTRLHKSQMGLQYLYINESIAKKCEVIGNIFDNPELLE